MRILVTSVAHFPAQNGQAIFTQNLAEGLAGRGHNVMVVFPSEKEHAYSMGRRGVQIEAIKSISLNWLHADSGFSLFSVKTVQKIFDAFRPEIVHIQDHYPLSRDVLKVARQRHIKVVGTNHFMPENLAAYVPLIPKIKPVYDWIMWRWVLDLYNRVDATAAQSKAAAALLRAQGLHPPVYPVSCGLDLAHFRLDSSVDRIACRTRYGLDPNRKIFLFVGRVDREKRLDVLLHAMRFLNRDDIQLVISGHGAASQQYQVLARELELGDRVRFTGFISNEDLPAMLNSADIFVMPSEAELLSIATLEAMACGRPVLLADAVALPELANNDLNGYLFKPGDAVDAARCMALLADHPERWSEMGRASLEKVRPHGLDVTMRKYEMIYKALLTNAPLQLSQLEAVGQKR
jgi:1,2-diacylglycerol 3-alpha-glucosyltransferase